MKHVKFLFREGKREEIEKRSSEVVEATFEDNEWEMLQLFCQYAEELFSESKIARTLIKRPTGLCLLSRSLPNLTRSSA